MASVVRLDPVEKKPLYHFLPGTKSLSVGMAGCNLDCDWCQNWTISRDENLASLRVAVTPASLVTDAIRAGAASISLTYNEPIIGAEFALEVAEAAATQKIPVIAVTNGSISPEARADFFGSMDAANVDLKGFREDFYQNRCGGSLRAVLDTLVHIRLKTRCHLEITTLLIPGMNDSESDLAAQCRWILAELGPLVPVHFSAYRPEHRLSGIPRTPLSILRDARAIATGIGLRHVYLGNVDDAEGTTTRCATCATPLIERPGYRVETKFLIPGECPHCHGRLYGRFQ